MLDSGTGLIFSIEFSDPFFITKYLLFLVLFVEHKKSRKLKIL
jgi:hypothetical protein